MRIILRIPLILLLIGSIRSSIINNVEVSTDTSEVVIEKWTSLDGKIKNVMESVVKQILPILIRTSSEVEISDECSATLTRFLFGLKQLKGWPLQLLDASGKFPSGSFYGTPSDLGSFEECLNLTVYNEATNEKDFQGQYCSVNFRAALPKRPRFVRIDDIISPLDNITTDNFIINELRKIGQWGYSLTYRVGVCVPSTCSLNDLKNIVDYVSDQVGMYGSVSRCEIRETLHFDGVQITAITIISVFAVICIIGTIVHAISDWKQQDIKEDESNQSLAKRIFTSFSVEKNLQKLLTVEENPNNISCINGIRFITIVWIILGHTYLFLDYQTLRGMLLFRSWVRDFTFQLVMNGLVSVDTFFFISGLLMSYLTVKYVDTKGRRSFNIPILIIRRFWRLLPSSAMIILFTLLIPTINSGPVWHEVTDFLSVNCRKKWWTDLIFINNFVPLGQMCLPHTWYTAADSQLFLAGLIFFFLLFRKPTLGMAFNIFLIIFSIVSTSAINYWKGLPPTMLTANPVPFDLAELIETTHFKPHVHAGPYCIGLALGVYFARCKKTKLRPMVVVFGWCFSIICNTSIIFSTYEWNRDTVPNVAISTFYSGIHRSAWALGVAWVVFACHNGYGGIVNRFLSWKGFVPLSRLTFMAYLWHFLIIVIYIGSIQSGLDCYHIFMVWIFLANTCVSFGLAFVSYLLYEGPFALLERVVFGRVFARENNNSNGATETFAKLDTKNEKTELPDTVHNGTYVIRM